jgi:PAS domain S-box-containing protein
MIMYEKSYQSKNSLAVTNSLNAKDIKEYFENIIALMPGHVYWKDRNGVFLGCNDEQAKFIGFKSRKDVVGLTAYDTLPHDFANKIMVTDNEIMDTGIPRTIEEILILPDGTESIWLSKKCPLFDKHGIVIGILGISFDITQLRKTEHELQAAKQRELDNMTIVAASIAHELRTPLASLSTAVHNLQDVLPDLIHGYLLAKEAGLSVKPIQPSYIELLQKTLTSMHKETRAAFTFIEMLLMNVKPTIEHGDEKIFSVGQVINDTLERYPFNRNQKQLVQWDNQQTQDFQVKGQPLLLMHVLFNLLKNALYFIEKAGKGSITIQLENGQSVKKLFFKDTGSGMPPEVLKHIFDRFFTRTHHGTGIGLTFCKMAMETFGGDIACESVEGEYTLFVLTFASLLNT